MNKISSKNKEEIIPQIKDSFLLNGLNLLKNQTNNIWSLYQKGKRKINAILEKDYLFTYLTIVYKTIK